MDEPIAIVGMGCRFPGDATSPERFWDMLATQGSAWTEIPKDRFNIDAFWHPHGQRQGSINLRGAHFLKEDISAFDAPFFSFTRKEAIAIDPQQRLLLEVTYEALENAGISIESLPGTDTSCFMGSFMKDYEQVSSRDPEEDLMYGATGSSIAIMSNRISWFFDLKGPSITLDTGCSASLVATHLACESLRRGESNMAIVGGSGLILTPTAMLSMTALNFLSPDGISYSFDSRANGYSRGEGIGVMVLKPLSRAIVDNDPIRAVIRGSAVRQDGRTPGIILPSREAQAALINSVYTKNSLDMNQTAYSECHGTGTPAGDPIETGAIGDTFGSVRPSSQPPLYIGSVKTNIGHLEGAAGLASLFKAVLAVENSQIPPNLWFENGNPDILFDEWKIRVPTELIPWPLSGPRQASVNSFGFGGTSAHVVIEDARSAIQGYSDSRITPASSQVSIVSEEWEELYANTGGYIQQPGLSPMLIMLSSHDQTGVDRLRLALQSWCERLKTGAADLPKLFRNLAFTLNSRRSVLPWKIALVAKDFAELTKVLSSPKVAIRSSLGQKPIISFVFAGQGAQWARMGLSLLQYPKFRRVLHKADRFLVSFGSEWSLLEELEAGETESRIHTSEFSQPCCTALQIAMVDLLAHFGVKSSSVMGHSSGEIAAAYCAGFLDLEEALKVAYFRGKCVAAITQKGPTGAMLAVGLGAHDTLAAIAGAGINHVEIACINSPMSTTVSGDAIDVERLERALIDDGIFCRKLRVSVAYHSTHMHRASAAYFDAIGNITPKKPQATSPQMYSTVTTRQVPSTEVLGANYWVKNLISPVEFQAAFEKMLSCGRIVDAVVELSPSAILRGPIRDNLKSLKLNRLPTYLSCMSDREDYPTTMLESMGMLRTLGVPLNLQLVNSTTDSVDEPVVLTNLPSYCWNHSERYWHEGSLSRAYRFRKAPRHNLLGAETTESTPFNRKWRNYIRISESPWIRHHEIQKTLLYPGAGMAVMALEAIRQVVSDDDTIIGFEVTQLSITRAMIIPDDSEGLETVFSLQPARNVDKADDTFSFSLISLPKSGIWIHHCEGFVRSKHQQLHSAINRSYDELACWDSTRDEYETLKEVCTMEQNPRQLYEGLETVGLKYGKIFQNIVKVCINGNCAVARLKVPDTRILMPAKYEHPHLIHPAFLDSLFQTIFLSGREAMVPTYIERIYIAKDISSEPGHTFEGFSRATMSVSRHATGSVCISDTWKSPSVVVEGIKCTTFAAPAAGDLFLKNSRNLCSELAWVEDVDLVARDRLEELCNESARLLELPRLDLMDDLETTAMIYIVRAVRKTENKASDISIAMPDLYKWMREMLTCYITRLPDSQGVESFLEGVALETIDGRCMKRFGDNLFSIVTGAVDGLELLTQSNEDFETYYGQNISIRYLAPQVGEWCRRMSLKHAGRRILEVGAGTAAFSKLVLEGMTDDYQDTPLFSSYTFTDISPAFFENAKEILGQWTGLIDFRRLDIENDPLSQGYEEGSYDLIIASNVVHVSKSVDQALANIRKLLKPGGILVLAEVTTPLKSVSIIYGALHGWWQSEDGREGGPTLTEDKWDAALKRCNFSGVDMSLHNFQELKYRCMTVMISVAVVPQGVCTDARSFTSTDIAIIEPDNIENDSTIDKFSGSLAKQLGQRTSRIRWGEATDANINGKLCICLAELLNPILYNVSAQQFETLQHIVRSSAGILWLTSGGQWDCSDPAAVLINGVFRVLRSEDALLSLHTLDLQGKGIQSSEGLVEKVYQVFQEIFKSPKGSRETEYALRNGNIYISRFLVDTKMSQMIDPQEVLKEQITLPSTEKVIQLSGPDSGSLDSVHFAEVQRPTEDITVTELDLSIEAATLSSLAEGEGKYHVLGGQISRLGGVSKTLQLGQNVLTCSFSPVASSLRVSADHVHRMPNHLSAEQAVGLISALISARYAFSRGSVSPEDTILIHEAMTAIGQAMVQLALHIGVPAHSIFVTVTSREEKHAMIDKYNIPAPRILDNNAAQLATGVLDLTNGQGVDVLLDASLRPKAVHGWDCVGFGGRIIITAALSTTSLTQGSTRILEDAALIIASVDSVSRRNPTYLQNLASECCELITKNTFRPLLHLPVFQINELKPALETAKREGHVIVHFRPGTSVTILPKDPHPLNLDPSAVYILVGGLGGIGRSVARLLILRGVKHVAFISRTGENPEISHFLRGLRSLGATTALAYACDICDRRALQKCISCIKSRGLPIKGVIQAAAVVKDSTFDNLTAQDFISVTRPKVQGSWNLHESLPQTLDFFIILSSSAGVMGTRGQSNYAAGNCFEDALAHYRRRQGLPCIALDLGMILGVGMVAEDDRTLDILKNSGFIGITEEELHKLVVAAMKGYSLGEALISPQVICGLGTGGLIIQNRVEDPYWLQDNRFSVLRQVDVQHIGAKEDASAKAGLRLLSSTATTLAEATDVIATGICQRLAESMAVPEGDVDRSKSISDYGVDSLVAVEMRSWFSRQLQVDISIFDILSPQPMADLAGKIASDLGFL